MMKKKWEFYWKQILINILCRKKYLFYKKILINIFFKKIFIYNSDKPML